MLYGAFYKHNCFYRNPESDLWKSNRANKKQMFKSVFSVLLLLFASCAELLCFCFFFKTFYFVVWLCSALLQEYMERLEKKDCSPFMCKQVKAGMSNKQDEVSISINRNDVSMVEEYHRPVSQQFNPRRQVHKAWANVDLHGLAESSGTQAQFVCFSLVGITYYKTSRWILFYIKVQIYFFVRVVAWHILRSTRFLWHTLYSFILLYINFYFIISLCYRGSENANVDQKWKKNLHCTVESVHTPGKLLENMLLWETALGCYKYNSAMIERNFYITTNLYYLVCSSICLL